MRGVPDDLVSPAPAMPASARFRRQRERIYRGASIERIAAALDVTRGSFYHHVDAKDDLVLACFRDSYGRMLRIFEIARERGLTGWPRLAAGIVRGDIRAVDPLIASQLIMSTIDAAYDIHAWAGRQPRAQAILTYASALTTGIFDAE